MNIYSGAGGLGSALTNPTALAKKKGKLVQEYKVVFRGKEYIDAETAYQVLKTGDAEIDDALMAEIICAKLKQHSRLLEEIDKRGGKDFLLKCTHYTYARTARFKAWEGAGLASRFIRNLIAGYILAKGE